MTLRLALEKSALRTLAYSGLPALFRRRYAGLGAILALHRIYRPQGPHEFGNRRNALCADSFRRIIHELQERDFDFVTMTELIERLRSPHRSARKFVCLTFDDGWQDTYTGAFAICREFNIPLVAYVMTGAIEHTASMWWLALEQAVASNDEIVARIKGRIDHYPAHTTTQKRRAYFAIAARLANASPAECRAFCDALAADYGIDHTALTAEHVLTPAMIAEMEGSGLVEFGAHTVSHANLHRLPAELARREMAASRDFLEHLLGDRVIHFAYPYGAPHAAGPREFALCRELGFVSAVTTRMNTLAPADHDRLHALPRLSLNGDFEDVPLLDLLLSGALPTLRQWFSRAPA